MRRRWASSRIGARTRLSQGVARSRRDAGQDKEALVDRLLSGHSARPVRAEWDLGLGRPPIPKAAEVPAG